MNQRARTSPQLPRRMWLATAAVALAFSLASCGQFQFKPMTVHWQESTTARLLTAEQIVHVLDECGLTDAQILRHGPEIRRALAGRGGARITERDVIVALMIIQSDGVMVLSGKRGSFFIPLGPEETSAATLATPETATN